MWQIADGNWSLEAVFVALATLVIGLWLLRPPRKKEPNQERTLIIALVLLAFTFWAYIVGSAIYLLATEGWC